MKNIFNTVKIKTPGSNTFDLTHDVKMSGKMGLLMPIMNMEVVPGDKIKLACDTLIRFQPLVAPPMHRFDCYVHYFFVPNRILWDNWEKFITQQATGGIPTIQVTNAWTAEQQRLGDYLGIPPMGSTTGVTNQNINALPFAAYQAIYNEYYRDQNLVAEVNYQLNDGANALGVFATLRRRAWEHDYFTAALPFAQKGAAVDIPLGTVVLNPDWSADNQDPKFVDATMSHQAGTAFETNLTTVVASPVPGPGIDVPAAYDPNGSLEVGSTTINDLRRAFRLQEFLEKMARGGTRYIEMILAHFGVRSSDKRLQRPEYITGTKSPVVISEVLATFGDDVAGIPQGTMAGHGVSVGDGYVGSYEAEEHGYIIGIMSVLPKPAYQQGIPRTFLKTDPLEWYWESFANIGEQEIQNQELYAYTTTAEETFGYIPRYAEYKYMPSRVAGDMRGNLDFWQAGRIFASQPTLSQQFIEMDDAEVERIFAVNNGDDNLIIHCLNKIQARRKMPVFGTPQL